MVSNPSASRTVHAFSVDVDELESAVREACGLSQVDAPSFLVQNTIHTLDLLDEFGVRATFFVNGRSVEPHPGLVKRIADAGHEIAAHSYAHRFLHSYQSAVEFRRDLERCVALIEHETGRRPIGYRAPGNTLYPSRALVLPVLKELGFLYDSSLPAVGSRKQHGYTRGPDQPFQWDNGMIELPLTSYSLLGVRVPVMGAHALRLLPYWLTARGLRQLEAEGRRGYLYLHSFELFRQPVSRGLLRTDFPTMYLYLARRGRQVERKLRRLFREFSFGPYCDCLEEISAHSGARHE